MVALIDNRAKRFAVGASADGLFRDPDPDLDAKGDAERRFPRAAAEPEVKGQGKGECENAAAVAP